MSVKRWALALNCGSSSIKFALFDATADMPPRRPEWNGKVDGITGAQPTFGETGIAPAPVALDARQPYHAVGHGQIQELAVVRVAAAEVAGRYHGHFFGQRIPAGQRRLLLAFVQSELGAGQYHGQLGAHGMGADGPVMAARQSVLQRLHARIMEDEQVEPDVGVDDETGHGMKRRGRSQRAS